MDSERLDIEKTLQYLTLDEKLHMLSGDGMWHTFGVGELPRVRMSDGPNGLRMTDGANTSAVPSTCYPTPAMLANSWDLALLYSVGAAIGKEATAMGVNLLLAPGVNIKRHPLGGRNFEYFSEDPMLSGELGKAFISGVQSTGVGACVKHFAANSQETWRMYSDSVVDPRALREIYLKPFETALKAEPAAVMCAYNKLNGVYCSQNEFLLKDILRETFAYKGMTVSDWGAVHDRAAALNAGLDLEMPDSLGMSENELRAALDDGVITEETVDNSLRRELELIDNVYLEPFGDYDADAHDRLSYNAAVDSVVLLKNDNRFLPLTKDMKVAVMGSLAECAPIEGEGSSHVVPLKYLTPLDAFGQRSVEITYYKGYSEDPKENSALYDEALSGALTADAVIVYAGTDAPAEGADRRSLDLPDEQNKLILGLTNAGHRVIVVLVTPGPVSMPWIKRVRSVVYAGLNGQNGALAAVDVIYGRVNPRGKLAETFPIDAAELGTDFGERRTLYRESIFVGYRYYDAIKRRVLFPFGHGLGFADISYGDVHVKRLGNNEFDVTVELANSSARDGYEIVQVYVSDRTGRVMCAEKQLAGFKKVFIEGMTATSATIHIDAHAFEFFNVAKNTFSTCDGEFKIMVGASSADIKKEISVKIDGDFTDRTDIPQSYRLPLRQNITDDDFKTLYGAELPEDTPRPVKGEYTLDSCVDDIKHCIAGRIALGAIKKRAKNIGKPGSVEREAFINSAALTPLYAVVAMSDGAITAKTALGMVEMANGKFFKGIKTMLKKDRTED